ncbi:MAG: hypothetical protein R2712_04380 [Vicinamibacterales bacterium]
MVALVAVSGLMGRARAPAGAVTLHLSVNQAFVGSWHDAGQRVRGLTYAGPPVAVDVLFGAILPDGDSIVASARATSARLG